MLKINELKPIPHTQSVKTLLWKKIGILYFAMQNWIFIYFVVIEWVIFQLYHDENMLYFHEMMIMMMMMSALYRPRRI